MKAIGYVRVSTDEQADSGLGLLDQSRKVDAAALLADAELIDTVIDDGYSAKSLDRPGMAQVLERVEGGEVDAIVIAKLDRLTRSVFDLGGLLKTLGKAQRASGGRGVHLLSAGENIDTSSATGRLMVNLLASVAEWERDVIRERTSAALQERKRQGYAATGSVPYGFDVDEDGLLVANEREQVALQILRERRAEGLGWTAIAAELTERGHRTRAGTEFRRQGLYKLAKRLDAEEAAN